MPLPMAGDITNCDHSKVKLQFMILGHIGYMNSGPKHVLRLVVKNSLEEFLFFPLLYLELTMRRVSNLTVPF